MDNEELAKAITTAIKDGFNSLDLSGLGGSSQLDTGSVSPLDDTASSASSARVELSAVNTEIGNTDKDAKKLSETLKRTSAGVTGFVGGAMKVIGEQAKISFDFVADLNKELDDEVRYFRDIQEAYGGISTAAYVANEEVGGLAGQALDSIQHLAMVSAGGEDMALSIESGAMKGKNALIAMFKDPKEAANLFMEVLEDFNTENLNMAKSLQAQGEAEMERIAIIRKRMGVGAGEMSDILRRQYAFTGEASAKIFEDIASVSVSLAEQTGASAESLKSNIIEIMQDVDKFGDIGVDSAGRIAGALTQLGLDFQTFNRMTENFMNFDSAASKMGELSALFGIQMDAMEMTYLANEDQEEFLFRMREEILDAGLDVENMSKTRQRALADQLGMNVTQMQQFMREGELSVDQASMTAATESAKSMDGLATAADKFGGELEGALRGSKEFEESMRMQLVYSDKVARNIVKQRTAYEDIPVATQTSLKLSDQARDNAIAQMNTESRTMATVIGNINTGIANFATNAGAMAANVAGATMNLVGIKPDADGTGNVKVTGQVKVAADEKGQQVISQVNDSANRQSANHAEIESKTLELADNQLSMQADVTSLITAMTQEKTMNVNHIINMNSLSDKVIEVQEGKRGRFVFANADQG